MRRHRGARGRGSSAAETAQTACTERGREIETEIKKKESLCNYMWPPPVSGILHLHESPTVYAHGTPPHNGFPAIIARTAPIDPYTRAAPAGSGTRRARKLCSRLNGIPTTLRS